MKVGGKAKDFILKDRTDKEYQLSKIPGTKIVYFYPKDSTEGCTIEAKEFSSILDKFNKSNAIVMGISGGDNKTKQKFCSEHNLKHILLSDTDFKVSKEYGVYGEKTFMGKKYMGISRTTFIISKDNKIIHIFENVKALGHASEVLDFVSKLK